MSRFDSVVAVFHTHPDAEQAVEELQRVGIDVHSISNVAKDVNNEWLVVGS